MKKFSIIIIVCLTLIMIASVSAIESPSIGVSLMNQDPDPVGPGEYVDLRFRISNTKIDTLAKNFQVELDPAFPFSLDPGDLNPQ